MNNFGITNFYRIVIIILTLFIAWLLVCETDYLVGKENPGTRMDYYSSLYNPLMAPINSGISLISKESVKPFPSMENNFPKHKILQKNWQTMRDEAVTALQSGHMTKIKGDLLFKNIADEKWRKLYLKWHGPIDPIARQLCPKTCEILDSMPEIRIAMFSVLEPGAIITPHRGPFKGCLRYHLGLSCPKKSGCQILVDGQPYSWKDGEDVLFDDTYVHQVENSTDEYRIILFCDVDRPTTNAIMQNLLSVFIDVLGPITTRANNLQEKTSKL